MASIKSKIKQHIAYITINRAESFNSFNYEALVELGLLVERLHKDTEVRVVIITGAGDKAFSTGADLKERKHLSESEVRRNVKKIRDVFSSIAELPQPTIAAVNGYAFGGGFELMLACDFKIAAKTAVLGMTEVNWGIIPGAGGTQRLARLIGEMKAKELILTARKISALKALELGILTDVKEPGELMDACKDLASEILANAPIAVKQAKYAIQHGCGTDLQSGLAIESKAYEVTIPTKDRVEALKAFSEKRQPVFTAE